MRGAFWAFVALLAAESALLLRGAPEAFPWAPSRGDPVIDARVLLGAMLFLLDALVRDAWGGRAVLLAGLRACGLARIGPLLGHLDGAAEARRPVLLVSLAAVAASGLLAPRGPLLDPRTRVLAPRPAARA